MDLTTPLSLESLPKHLLSQISRKDHHEEIRMEHSLVAAKGRAASFVVNSSVAPGKANHEGHEDHEAGKEKNVE